MTPPTPPPRRSGRLGCIGGRGGPSSPSFSRIAGGLKLAQAQAMAVAVAGLIPDPQAAAIDRLGRRSPLLHRASFHGRGQIFQFISLNHFLHYFLFNKLLHNFNFKIFLFMFLCVCVCMCICKFF